MILYFSVPFNVFLDKMRDPKDIQEEVLKKKLKTVHPFKGDLVRKKRVFLPREFFFDNFKPC